MYSSPKWDFNHRPDRECLSRTAKIMSISDSQNRDKILTNSEKQHPVIKLLMDPCNAYLILSISPIMNNNLLFFI